MSFEILTVSNSSRWMEVIERIGYYDFYHLPSYSELAEIRGEGKALLAVYQEGEHIIAFPLLVRDIEIAGYQESGLKDATSVYGYPGPVASPNLPEETRQKWLVELDSFFRKGSIVCAFTRLHPLLENHKLLQGYGDIVNAGVTIAIDTTVPEDEQIRKYRTNHRRDIKRLAKDGYSVKEAAADFVDEFADMYIESMSRIGADSYYYFDKPYFRFMMHNMQGISHIFVCERNGEIAAAHLITFCKGIIQYHLGATKDKYLKEAPSKLLVDEIRRWGCSKGAKILHLGGGLGGKQDSLYHFKRGFSNIEHEFMIWKHIVDKELYDVICKKICARKEIEPDTFYFPLYRHPIFETAGAFNS